MFVSKTKHMREVEILKHSIRKLKHDLEKETERNEKIQHKARSIYGDLTEEIKILRRIASEYNHPHICGWCDGYVHRDGEMHSKCLDAKTDALMDI